MGQEGERVCSHSAAVFLAAQMEELIYGLNGFSEMRTVHADCEEAVPHLR